MFNENNAMQRELEKGQIKRNNRLFLTYIVAAIFLGMIVINPIGLIVGVIVYFIDKNKAFIISISSLILGIILLFINSLIMKIPVIQAIKNYFFNFVEFKSGKGKVDFLSDYFLNGLFGSFFLFFGLAVLVGMYVAYWYSSYNNREEARIKSRKRFDASGNETKFIDYSKISDLKETIVKSRKEITHRDVDGIYMGLNGLKKVVITDKEMAGHAMVIGSTGRGKTVALLNIVESCVQRELPIIFVDGKWDSDLPEKMRKLANQNDRPFYHFDMRGILSEACYNPLKIGDSDNVKEKLIDITDWSEEHYKANSERALMLVVRVIEQLMKECEGLNQDEIDEKISIDRTQKSFLLRKDVICIQRMLIPDMLDRCINAIDDDDIRRECHDIFERMEHPWYAGLESRLALLAESNLRNLVKENDDGINLIEALDEGAVVLFSLDALRNNSATKLLGRLIVKDVNTCVSMRNKGDTVYSIYDEHGAYITEDIDALFAMARSYGLHVITSTQNAADYKKSRLGDVLMRKVFGNTNLKLVLMQNEASDADYLASTVGTEKITNRTLSTDDNNEYKGSGIKDVEEFILHPNRIKDLGIGEGYLIRKIPKQSVSFVKIKMIEFEKIGKDKEIDLENNETEKEFDLEIKKENKLDFKENIKKNKMVKMEKGIKRDPLERRKRRLKTDKENK